MPNKTMTAEEKLELCAKIDYEGGLESTMCGYSSFPEIKDRGFHSLRKAFVTARDALAKYLGLDEYDGSYED